jgi:hypothetical protein
MSISKDPGVELAEFVEDMIVQLDYPGFEARAFKVGLPEHMMQASSRVFGDALGHQSIYVRITALRWFQEKTGAIKPHLKAISGLVSHEDPWVRHEAGQALERYLQPTVAVAMDVCKLLKDDEAFVRRGAAKGLAKILPRLREQKMSEEQMSPVVEALKDALADNDGQVRQKAEKALRRGGFFAG